MKSKHTHQHTQGQLHPDGRTVLIPVFDPQEFDEKLRITRKQVWRMLPKSLALTEASQLISSSFEKYRSEANAKLDAKEVAVDTELKCLNAEKDSMKVNKVDRVKRHLRGLASKRKELMRPVTAVRMKVAENCVVIESNDEIIADDTEFQETYVTDHCNGTKPQPNMTQKGWLYPVILTSLGVAEGVVNFQCLQSLTDNLKNIAIVPITLTLTASLLIGAHFCGASIATGERKIAVVAGALALGGIAITMAIRVTSGSDVMLASLNVLLGVGGGLLAYFRSIDSKYFSSVKHRAELERTNANLRAFNAASEADAYREEQAIDEQLEEQAAELADDDERRVQTLVNEFGQLKNSIASFRKIHSRDIDIAEDALKVAHKTRSERSRAVRAKFRPDVLSRLFPFKFTTHEN